MITYLYIDNPKRTGGAGRAGSATSIKDFSQLFPQVIFLIQFIISTTCVSKYHRHTSLYAFHHITSINLKFIEVGIFDAHQCFDGLINRVYRLHLLYTLTISAHSSHSSYAQTREGVSYTDIMHPIVLEPYCSVPNNLPSLICLPSPLSLLLRTKLRIMVFSLSSQPCLFVLTQDM